VIDELNSFPGLYMPSALADVIFRLYIIPSAGNYTQRKFICLGLAVQRDICVHDEMRNLLMEYTSDTASRNNCYSICDVRIDKPTKYVPQKSPDNPNILFSLKNGFQRNI